MRKLAMAAFSFAAGIFLSQYLLPSLSSQLIAAAAAAFCALIAFLLKGTRRKKAVLIFCALSVGFIYHAAFCHFLVSPAKALDGSVKRVELETADYPEQTAYGAKVTVRIRGENLPFGKAVFFGGEELLALEPGSTVLTQAEFDFTDQSSYAQQKVFLLLYDCGEAVVKKGGEGAARYLPQRINHAICNKVKELYNDGIAAFMASILVGETDELSPNDRAALSDAGLWHITAVSGLHCSFLIALLALFLGKERHGLKAVLGIPLLVAYALTVGGSPSVVRSVIMIAFVLIAPIFNRDNDPLTALSTALLFILLSNPFAAGGTSLQLSFAAVLGLMFLAPRLNRAFKGMGGRFGRILTGSLSATLGALIFTVPLTVIYFNTFTLITPVSNLLCLWAVSAAFSLGLLSVGLAFLFPPLGAVFAWAAELLARYVLFAADTIAQIPYHAVYFSDARMKYWLVYAYMLFLLCFLAKSHVRRRAAAAVSLAVCTLALSLFVTGREAVSSPLSVTVLDVGQGQCILLTSGKECVIVDCGSSNAATDAGERAAEELFRRGYYTPRALILTHLDTDHINGVASLCARTDVEEIRIPVIRDEFPQAEAVYAAADRGSVSVTAGETMTFGEAEITVFSPLSGQGGNNGGLAVLCSAEEFDVLITGDMDKNGEEALLELLPQKEIEVLVAGHHGANDACSEELLRAAKPEAVIVSVGENRFGHPGYEMQMRVKEALCVLYRTDLMGNICIRAN